MADDRNLVDVVRMKKYFPIRGGFFKRSIGAVRAVDDVSFFIRKGETLGLVGESGCGKTTVGRSIMMLTPPTEGYVFFETPMAVVKRFTEVLDHLTATGKGRMSPDTAVRILEGVDGLFKTPECGIAKERAKRVCVEALTLADRIKRARYMTAPSGGEEGDEKTKAQPRFREDDVREMAEAALEEVARRGTINFKRKSHLRRMRSRIQFVFQDPFSSLDPKMLVKDIVAEPLQAQLRNYRLVTVKDERGKPVYQMVDKRYHLVATTGPAGALVFIPVPKWHLKNCKLLTVKERRARTRRWQVRRWKTIYDMVDDDHTLVVTTDPAGTVTYKTVPTTTATFGVAHMRPDAEAGLLQDKMGLASGPGLKLTKRVWMRERVTKLLEHVGLNVEHMYRYPHEFSGGQRQRIGIARALSVNPDFVVLDEPTSALDVSVQAQILNMLNDLQDDFGLTYLFISHDLSTIRYMCDRVAVMYLGKIVEYAVKDELFANPTHPYTEALLSVIPAPDPDLRRDRIILAGDVPSPANPPPGCRFHTRCPLAKEICSKEEPPLTDRGNEHYVACHVR